MRKRPSSLRLDRETLHPLTAAMGGTNSLFCPSGGCGVSAAFSNCNASCTACSTRSDVNYTCGCVEYPDI